MRKKEIHAQRYKYPFLCYTIHALNSIPSFLTWLCCLLWAQLFHELVGQALGICGSSPVVSQGPANVQPWAGSWNNSSPHAGLEEGYSPPNQVEERGPDGERKSCDPGSVWVGEKPVRRQA